MKCCNHFVSVSSVQFVKPKIIFQKIFRRFISPLFSIDGDMLHYIINITERENIKHD